MDTIPPFDDLVDRHSAEIYRYLWRMLYDTQDAEDMLQDTFLRAFKAYPRLRPESNTRAWLYSIATNTARTFATKRKTRAMRVQPLEDYFPSSDPSPAEHTANRAFLAEVLAAVAALPHKQRAALMMRKYQELDYAEIAAALDTSEEAARANVYQAAKRLRKEFREAELRSKV